MKAALALLLAALTCQACVGFTVENSHKGNKQERDGIGLLNKLYTGKYEKEKNCRELALEKVLDLLHKIYMYKPSDNEKARSIEKEIMDRLRLVATQVHEIFLIAENNEMQK